MPPPSLLSTTIVAASPKRPDGEQAVHVVVGREVAQDEGQRGLRPGGRDPERGRDDAVDAAGAAVAVDVQRRRAGTEHRVEVADRHAVARDDRGARRQRVDQVADRAGLGEAVAQAAVAYASVNSLGSTTLPLPPCREPGRIRCRGRPQCPQQTTADRGRVGVEGAGGAQVGVVPAPGLGDHDLLRVDEPRQERAQRLRRRRPADPQHDLGPKIGAGRGAQHRVVPGDDVAAIVRAASQLGERVGQDRIAQRGGEAGDRLDAVGGVLRPRDDQPAPPLPHQRRQRRDVAGRRLDPRRRPRAIGREHGGGRQVWDQRLAEGEVEVHRPGGRGRRQDGGASAPVPGRAGGRIAGDGQGRLGEGLGVAAVQAQLIDGLIGAHPAQLRRTVGGQDDERQARRGRLGDRRREVERGAARGAEQRDGRMAGLGQPQREVRAGALVEVDPGAQGGMALHGDRDRRGARAGAEADVVDAPGDEPVGQRGDEQAQRALRGVRRGALPGVRGVVSGRGAHRRRWRRPTRRAPPPS